MDNLATPPDDPEETSQQYEENMQALHMESQSPAVLGDSANHCATMLPSIPVSVISCNYICQKLQFTHESFIPFQTGVMDYCILY